ncbi:MAG: phenylalanine--tRNA ligase subunit beta [Clostridia bacterium]|nr:phenylalanine--tRNA ligase subunit beta [Clostridia bacterium]
MKAPLSWLKDYVDIDVTAEELQKKLFGCGFEVEELIEIGKDISGVVVGEVIECEPVEGTHLSVCKVDCGDKGIFQICCGADNVKKGIKAPCALVGATVYATAKDHVTVEGVMTIKKGKLRGIESEGMLCSGAELGVNEDMFPGGDYCGLLLLPAECKNGEDVKPVLGLDDYIFDIGVTANRPDCQSIYGIAREVGAVLGKKVKLPDLSYNAVKGNYEKIKITDLAPELCPRYIGHYVKDVKIAPSPVWLKRKLALCGLRSINNIVDITNFILLELGQPMHAFDLRTLAGREVKIRRAENGEKITTLDGNEFKLTSDNLVICDRDNPVALAGVMGGLDSEIENDTDEVLFESAKFARDNIRKTARALGQHSDSSALFEKGINEYTTEMAICRALHLIGELKCGTVTDVHIDVTTQYSNLNEKKLEVSVNKINALLGITVPTEKMCEILKSLNFDVKLEGDTLGLVVPRYREDIDGYPDIAEEVIRMYGYEHINGTFLPSASITNGGFNDAQKAENKLKNLLVGKGLYEISTYSFYSPKDLDMLHFAGDAQERKAIRILNPISEELSIMRTTLAPSMVNVIVRNLRRGNLEGKLFELAKIYIPKELPIKSFPEEKLRLSLGMWGKYGFFDMKGIIESVAHSLNTTFEFEPAEKPFLHPGITAKISCEGEEVGYVGQLSHTVANELVIDRAVIVAELDYDKLTTHAKAFRYTPIPKHAEVVRDLALVCNEDITCGQITKEIYSACKYVTDVKLFDIYVGAQVGKDKKSMAFNVTFTPKDEPIEDKVDGFVKKILNNLKFKLDVTLR